MSSFDRMTVHLLCLGGNGPLNFSKKLLEYILDINFNNFIQ